MTTTSGGDGALVVVVVSFRGGGEVRAAGLTDTIYLIGRRLKIIFTVFKYNLTKR